MVGNGGDVGLFSFDKGKNVSAIDGGVVVTNDDALAIAFERECEDVRAPGVGEVWRAGGEGADLQPIPAAVALLDSQQDSAARPGKNGVHDRLSARVADEVPDGPGRRGAAPARGADARAHRERGSLDRGAAHDPGPAVRRASGGRRAGVSQAAGSSADSDTRDRALAALTLAGIGASRSVSGIARRRAGASAMVRRLRRGPTGGRHVAQRILTLPTHPFVSADDISRTAAVLRSELDGRRYRQASPAA